MATDVTTRLSASGNTGITTENAGKADLPDSYTIPEKIIHFLTENLPNAYCDDCLAEALHLRRTQVSTMTSTLGYAENIPAERRALRCAGRPENRRPGAPPTDIMPSRKKGSLDGCPGFSFGKI